MSLISRNIRLHHYQTLKLCADTHTHTHTHTHKHTHSLVPGPSLAPVFDCLQYAKTEASDQKLESGKAWERGYTHTHTCVCVRQAHVHKIWCNHMQKLTNGINVFDLIRK